MLDPNRPPTHRSEEPEHETVVWDRLSAEAESSRGSSVYPAAKLSDASESVYLEYDDDELLEAMHADEDEDQGSAKQRSSQPPPPPPDYRAPDHRAHAEAIDTTGEVVEDDDEPAEEDLEDEISALAHLTVPADELHAGSWDGDDVQEQDDGALGLGSSHDADGLDADDGAGRRSQPPLLLQGRGSEPPLLPSRASQPPFSSNRSSQPGIMDRTFPPPNDRERGSQPPSQGYTFQAAVPPSYPTSGSGDRISRPPPLSQGRSSQPPLPPSFVTAETVEDAFAQAPEQSIFERTKDLFEPPPSAQTPEAPGARWEKAWAEWDKQFDIPALAVEPASQSRSRILPVAIGVLALIGLSAAGFQMMGASSESAAPAAPQAQAAEKSAAEIARDEAAVKAANDALEAMARADAELKKKTAEKLAAANAGTQQASGNGGGAPQQVAAQVAPSGGDEGMSKASERERYREERRAAKREARHRKRELKRQQARAEAASGRTSGEADAPKKGKQAADADDPLYGVGDEEE